MKRQGSVLLWLILLLPFVSSAQIDPVKRDLLQIGYNGVLEGRQPFSGYAFYYHNQPDFLKTNLTMRLAIAPTYMDNELGIANALGPNTDLGIGIAGGGFADSYNEFQNGQYLPQQSFDGFGGEGSMALYHLFDPGRLIPLYLVVRGTTHYSTYSTTSDTEPGFELPPDHLTGSVRAGLRFGGVEPTLFPSLAMELSVWYEGDWRSKSGSYGPPAGSGPNTPYELNPQSQLFWTEAALSYTFDNKQNFYVRITAGTSIDADRFSAYRLGAFLPLVAEFPLSLPGFYYQEISARQFVLVNANYLIPLDKKNRWDLAFNASTAVVDYLPGTGQAGNSVTGVAGGVMWHSPTDRWKIIVDYARGINAVRNGERGSNSIGVLVQVDFGTPGKLLHLSEPSLWQGFQRMLDLHPFND